MSSMKSLLFTAALVLCYQTVYGLDVVIHAQVKGNDTSKIVVSTNLPDKTKGYIIIHKDSSDYLEHIEAEVSGGSFKALRPRKPTELCPGRYMLEVALTPVQFQPSTVQSVIGRKGELLEGNFVSAGMLGKGIYYSKGILVGKD